MWGRHGGRWVRENKHSGILLCSKRMPCGRRCGVDRKTSAGQKENLRSPYPTLPPTRRPCTCGLRLVVDEHLRHAPPGPVSNVFGLLPASTPSPLPASHLSGMLQDSLDQCLHNAPKKNDPVAKCLSHLAQSPFAPLVWPSHQSGGHTQQHFFTRPHQLGGPAGFLPRQVVGREGNC